jgi:hypothetical protein
MDFRVTETGKASPTISSLDAVSVDLVALWVNQWKRTGFLR